MLPDGAHVLRHVLAGLAVAARGGLHQHAVLVAQVDRQAVELELGVVVHRRRVFRPAPARGARARRRRARRRPWCRSRCGSTASAAHGAPAPGRRARGRRHAASANRACAARGARPRAPAAPGTGGRTRRRGSAARRARSTGARGAAAWRAARRRVRLGGLIGRKHATSVRSRWQNRSAPHRWRTAMTDQCIADRPGSPEGAGWPRSRCPACSPPVRRCPGAMPSGDPLPSWNDGANKQRIVAFVQAPSRSEGGKDYVAARGAHCRLRQRRHACGSSTRCTSSSSSCSTASRHWRRSIPNGRDKEPYASLLKGDVESRTRQRRARDLSKSSWRPRRHDAPRSSRRSSRTGPPPQDIRATSAVSPNDLPADARSPAPTCAPTASRPSSSRVAASSSCGRGRRRSMASRPSRWSAAASRPAFEMRGTTPVLDAAAANWISSTTRQGKPVGINLHYRPPADRRLRQLRRRLPDAAMDHHRPGPAPGHARAPRRRRARVRL